jgi:branched-chain amino acid transport system substrate-binding protein
VIASVVAMLTVLLPGGGSVGSAAAPGCDTSRGVLEIGVIAPLGGDLAGQGAGIRNAVDVAVRAANERCAVAGYRLAVDAVDEAGEAEAGAVRLASTPTVLGVVGAFGSPVTAEAQWRLRDSGIVLISPTASWPELSVGDDPGAPVRPYPAFFRMNATEADIGRALADDLAAQALRNVVVVEDGSSYGEALRTGFLERAARYGFAVLAQERLAPDPDPVRLVTTLRTLGPQVVLYAGEAASAPRVGDAMRAAGVTAPLAGGDEVRAAGAARPGADGDLAAVTGVPTAFLGEPGRAFADAYAAGRYDAAPTDASALAHDAAATIVAAAAAVVGDRGWDPALRPQPRDEVQRTRTQGATGTVAFDEFGDPVRRLVTVYERRIGSFVPARLLAVEP